MCPTEKNTEAIKCFPRPTTVKEVKRLLGLANFYHRHIKDMGIISKPLTSLTQKDKQTGQPTTFSWNDLCERVFQNIKQALTSSPVLMPPNFDKEFFVWVDASEEGFGVIVEQNDDDGILHPKAYASRATIMLKRSILQPN